MVLGIQLADSWCEIATLATVVIGGGWALYQWGCAIRSQRAETMARLFELCEQKEVYLTFNTYVLKAGRLSVTPCDDTFEFQDVEKPDRKSADIKTWIDTMLTFFNQACYMKKHEIIVEEEFTVFERQIQRLFDNSQIKKYLLALQQEPESASPYELLVDYAKSKGWWPCKC